MLTCFARRCRLQLIVDRAKGGVGDARHPASEQIVRLHFGDRVPARKESGGSVSEPSSAAAAAAAAMETCLVFK